jgi:hypothetical protein
MPDDHLVLPADMPSQAKLTEIIRRIVIEVTQRESMVIEDIATALAFTAGYAIGNQTIGKERSIPIKTLRHMALEALDRGIKDGQASKGVSSIIMPNLRVVK